MPSTRDQKAKEKRSRQSDVTSFIIGNKDMMLGIFPGNCFERQETTSEIKVDLESERH